MFMDIYEERMDSDELLSGAINTYRVIVLDHDYEEIVEETKDVASFFIDVSDFYSNSGEEVANALIYCLKIFEDNEHYEKCADIVEFITELEDEF
jgi:hypothetical protein|tara:strand:+ start:1147 stop:1431 length:285 start_codon:yes stop_codon:yes gene_type:complete